MPRVIGGQTIPQKRQGIKAMAERPRFFDDLAGVAGGAMSALAGLREEIEALARARIDEAIRRLELVRREEFDAMAELAANARAGQEAAESKLQDMLQRVAALEIRVTALETQRASE
jgi:BMFP domain-containing protein YqiC